MEKYKEFVDSATGVNPFDPRSPPSSTLARLAAVILLPLRLPLTIAIFLALLSFDACAAIMSLCRLRLVYQLLFRPAEAALLRIFLAAVAGLLVRHNTFPKAPNLSFRNYSEAGTTRSLRRGKEGDDAVSVPPPGSLVLVNCQSAFDPLLLSLHFGGGRVQYAFPLPNGNARVVRSPVGGGSVHPARSSQRV